MSLNQKTDDCRIVLDAMGGDFAPLHNILGAVEAIKLRPEIKLFLAGDKVKIAEILADHHLEFPEENIIHTSQVIEMDESPTSALKNKPDSSIVVGAKMVKEGKADALVSAGNTGAMMAASTLIIGRIQRVGRPTIGAPFPSKDKVCFVFDAGASVDSKPNHLVEYSILSTVFVREIVGVENPKIGLLSVGEEEKKGNELTLKTFEMLKNLKSINFLGNVEGRDILGGKVDIVICDGFVGNIILKFAESVLSILKFRIRKYSEESLLNKIKAFVTGKVLKKALYDFNPEVYGGVPLLGVNGISIIGHGSSSVKAITNMILKAKEMHDKKLLEKFEKALKNYAE